MMPLTTWRAAFGGQRQRYFLSCRRIEVGGAVGGRGCSNSTTTTNAPVT